MGRLLDPSGQEGWKHSVGGFRGKLWDGPLVHCYGYEWQDLAGSSECKSSFMQFAVKSFEYARSSFPLPKVQEEVRSAPLLPAKRKRVVVDQPVPWHVYPQGLVALECMCDSDIVVRWVNGCSAVRANYYSKLVSDLNGHIVSVWHLGLLVPSIPQAPWLRHVYRELNTEADAFATRALVTKTSTVVVTEGLTRSQKLKAYSDGG